MIAESAGQSRGPRPDAFAVRFRSRATEACVIASNPGVFRAEALRWIRDPELIAAGAVKRRRDRRRCGSLETACQDGQSDVERSRGGGTLVARTPFRVSDIPIEIGVARRTRASLQAIPEFSVLT